MKKKHQWQGESIKVEFGQTLVTTVEEKPMWWYNFECAINNTSRAICPSIRITTDLEYVFCIANHHGIGVHKLLNGGWPIHQHFSLPNEEFESVGKNDFYLSPKKFDSEKFGEHENQRRIWQKNNFPEEFKKIEALRNIASKKF